MKKRSLLYRVIALSLMIAMLVTTFSACDLSGLPVEPTPGETIPPTEHIYVPDAKTYNITYIDAPTHNNPTTYTVNDYIILQKAVWNGLAFSHWSDGDGNVVTEIPFDTTGNLILKANWMYSENFVASNNTDEIFLTYYNDELNAFQFVYNLGTINNVVLDELASYRYNGATNHTWSISETVSFTESSANNVATTIANTVTKSNSWSKTLAATKDASSTTSASVSTELTAGWAGTKASIGGTIGGSSNTGTSDTTSNCSSGSTGSSSQESQSVSSTISYVQDTTTQVSRSETLEPALSPAGMYKYVEAGTVQVFAIVTYDPAVKDYYINIYSYIADTYETMLYEPIPEYNSDISIVPSAPFEFSIDIDALANNIGNAYTIQFDANGGTGSMPVQLMLPDTYTGLLSNRFTKGGYKFVGWRVKDGDKTIVYLDGQDVKNLGSPKETVTLEAVWASTEPQYSEWSEWSDWTLERKDTNALVKEESRALWSYYYFKCPSCGRHTPYYGYTCNTWKDGCGGTKIPESSYRWVFSEKSHNEVGLKQWYSTQKKYAIIDDHTVFASSNGQMTVYRYATRTVID